MRMRGGHRARTGLFLFATIWLLVILPLSAMAAPYAAMVIDARSGEVLHSRNADTLLHPASLTKMMTLYVVFDAIQHGEISLDTDVTISRKAAAEPPSKLGLREGQKIKLRYLIRAASVRSANDAATALAEAISGSEERFARRMTRTAKAMGLNRTTFKNAHGLTENGHLSTARDMTMLGRQLFFDFPQYYNLFSRRSTHAGVKEVPNTNRRFLDAYRGADGIKTGYTRAAGFNLVASAERGNKRIIATVFGGSSTAARNAKVAELLDLGFQRAPERAPLRKPARPLYAHTADDDLAPGTAGKTIRLVTAVKKSLRPVARSGSTGPDPVLVAVKDEIAEALTEAQAAQIAEGSDTPEEPATSSLLAKTPKARPDEMVLASTEQDAEAEERPDPEPEVVSRVSTAGGRHWGINLGRYPNQYQAEKVLLQTALKEMETLEGTLRKVVKRSGGFDANFMGMSRDTAEIACRRLQSRNINCFMVGPG
ncbi:D-alanyl-D-alanine carboxypeptidase family protein [Aquicoccus sp.]|uniref:D-alanyl-D-alanine carboxypeptidase family protein n=1 Tax=Aquicoccus sp. TaxID=2055851 RepID=UPI003563E7F8